MGPITEVCYTSNKNSVVYNKIFSNAHAQFSNQNLIYHMQKGATKFNCFLQFVRSLSNIKHLPFYYSNPDIVKTCVSLPLLFHSNGF